MLTFSSIRTINIARRSSEYNFKFEDRFTYEDDGVEEQEQQEQEQEEEEEEEDQALQIAILASL